MCGKDQLSGRASRFLERIAAPRREGADPAGALELASALGLPASAALAAFEADYGGLRFRFGRRDAVFGVAAMRAEDPDLRIGPDSSRVLIGREDSYTDVSMSADGRLFSPWAGRGALAARRLLRSLPGASRSPRCRRLMAR